MGCVGSGWPNRLSGPLASGWPFIEKYDATHRACGWGSGGELWLARRTTKRLLRSCGAVWLIWWGALLGPSERRTTKRTCEKLWRAVSGGELWLNLRDVAAGRVSSDEQLWGDVLLLWWAQKGVAHD